MRKLILLSAVFFFASCAGAFSYYSKPKINTVATIFAMRPVKVNCYSDDEPGSPLKYDAWGYVKKPTAKQHIMHVTQDLCSYLENINDESEPADMRALAILVIVHESYHLRNWGLSSNEAKVECNAIRHWKVGARLLGANEDTITELWPIALVLHYEETEVIDWRTGEKPYYDPSCTVPDLNP